MKQVGLLLLCVVTCLAKYPTDHESAFALFSKFQRDYSKQYASPIEEARRFVVFRNNLKRLNQKNALHRSVARFGIDQFTDTTEAEFKHNILMSFPPKMTTDEGTEYPEDEKNAFALFSQYKREFSKQYTSDIDEARRFEAFRDNLKKLNEKNKLHEGFATFGIDQFTDMSETEFKRNILMSLPQPPPRNESKYAKIPKLDKLPAEFSWAGTGAVTPVKNQGDVGTCWAFATVGNLEGQYFMKTKNTAISLSPEQIADCSSVINKRNEHPTCGPNGGWPDAAFLYVKETGGINSDRSYPYCIGNRQQRCAPCAPPNYDPDVCQRWPFGPNVCRRSDSCRAKVKPSLFVKGVRVKDYKFVSTNEKDIAAFLTTNGPLAVCLDASDLGGYRSGVLRPQYCRPDVSSIDHCVLLVGYGRDKRTGLDYWMLKNSWSERWGLQGYFKLERGVGACAVNKMVSTAVFAA